MTSYSYYLWPANPFDHSYLLLANLHLYRSYPQVGIIGHLFVLPASGGCNRWAKRFHV